MGKSDRKKVEEGCFNIGKLNLILCPVDQQQKLSISSGDLWNYKGIEKGHMVFIDLEKVYERVPCEVLWECLEKKEVSLTYIQVTRDMYERVKCYDLNRQH